MMQNRVLSVGTVNLTLWAGILLAIIASLAILWRFLPITHAQSEDCFEFNEAPMYNSTWNLAYNRYDRFPVFIDVNGDGLTDIAFNLDSLPGGYVFFSTGNSFFRVPACE